MRIKNGINLLFFIFLLVGTVIILRGQQPKATWHCAEGFIYGTSYRISYEHTENIDSALFKTMKKVDASLSMFNKQSCVSLINSGASTQIDSLLSTTLRTAFEVYEKTGGAFDVTVAPLVNLWGFGLDERRTVSKAQVDSVMSFIGMDRIALAGDSIIKQDTRTMLDFSAIAKGLGVDLVAAHLEKEGAENFFVEIGGEILCKGFNSKGHPWSIGISQPLEGTAKKIASKMQSCDRLAIATSGNYHNYYIKDGKRYAHTIDPSTGYPAEKDVLSATVVAPSCAVADAYATAFMVMGLEEALKIVEADTTLAAYFICDSTTVATERFKKYFTQK